MKIWVKIKYKHLFSSGSALEAVVPVIGSLLMLLILILLAGTAAVSLYNSAGESISPQPLVAKISLESCEGGLYGVGPMAERARCEQNRIVLMHEGGDSLPLDSVSIRISGYGNSYRPVFGQGTLKGNLSVFYMDLSPAGKNSTCYVDNNKGTLEDSSWDVGERFMLCGQDSAVGKVKSSVKVSVDGEDNTSDNYGFKAGSEIILKVIDTKSMNLITEQRAFVKHAEG